MVLETRLVRIVQVVRLLVVLATRLVRIVRVERLQVVLEVKPARMVQTERSATSLGVAIVQRALFAPSVTRVPSFVIVDTND